MKTQKQVQIIARYALKRHCILTGVVCYKVRSSNGHDEYCTTLVNGKATGCSCPAYKPCYHMIQLEALEQERRATAAHEAFITASNIVAKPGQTPVQCKRANALVHPRIEVFAVEVVPGTIEVDEKTEADMAWASIRRNLHRAETERIAREIEASKTVQAVSESIYERMQKAALNGPRAFSLLR